MRRWLSDNCIDLGADFADHALDAAMALPSGRKTVQRALNFIRSHADEQHRRRVLELLLAVARADNEQAPQESEFFLFVARHMAWFPEDAQRTFLDRD